jgi:hypothetical protein
MNAYSYKWEDCNGSSCSPVSYGIETPQCSGTSFSCPNALETNFSSYTVQPSDEGDELAVVVTAANGSSYTATAASTAVVPGGAPDNTTAPTASGTAAIGSVLTATQGSWSGSANTYSYQWNDCVEDDILPSGCQAISGATSSTYTVKSSDGGYKLDVTVTASNSNGSQAVSSGQTSSYVPVPPAAIGTPAIAGQTVLGTKVTAMYHFSGSVPSYSYQWQDCNSSGGSCQAISGATSQNYTIASSDEGSTLRVVVTASNDGGAQTASATSPASPLIQVPTGSGTPASTTVPVLTGTADFGGTITTSVGTWSGTPTSYAYQWQDCNSSGSSCSNVTAGGTAYAYTVGATDIGDYLRVNVTATNSSGSSTATSALTAAVPAPSSSQAAATPDGLTIVGDKFENDSGQPVTFHGEDLSGTDTACGNDGAFSDNMPATGATGAALAPWNSNGITLGTNEDCWLGINGTSPTGTTYQSDMNSFVNLLNSYGQYVMLSAKATAPGGQEAGPGAGEANAPDEDHSPQYWAGLASQFRNDPNVVDAVWSELASTSVYWNCYMSNECGSTASASGPGPYDGGGVCGGGAWACYYYTVATMQQAVDITRAMGFNGPISIPCIGYAVVCGDPTTGGSTYGGSWAQNHPTDPDNAMTAEAHWYEQDACDTNACHNTQLATINAAGYPLILGETGESGDNNAAPSCGSWSGTYNPPSSYGTYSSSYNGTEGWLPDLYSNGGSGWFAYAFNDFNSAGVLINNTSGAPYQPGTEPASGWYSNCLQTLDRSLPG